MKALRVAAVAIAIAVGATAFGQAQAPAPPAPAPGSPGTFRSAAELSDVLRKATPTPAGMSTSPVSNTDQYRINIVHRATPAGAIAHPGNTELHYIVEGSGTIVTGGVIRGQGVAATIEGGEVRRVAKGDVVVIPANSAHWYSAVDGAITYLEVRWPAPAK
jgi:mannose-6-phosphate isomerase-like protein (cupin superfamily)